PSADHIANVRARPEEEGDIHAPSAYAAYASTPTGRVIAVFKVNPPPIPGSRFTGPNPHNPPSPTHPDQIATAAGAAISTSRHGRRLPFTCSPSFTGVRPPAPSAHAWPGAASLCLQIPGGGSRFQEQPRPHVHVHVHLDPLPQALIGGIPQNRRRRSAHPPRVHQAPVPPRMPSPVRFPELQPFG